MSHKHSYIYYVAALFALTISRISFAVILRVPAEYQTIQSGIDFAQNGDTVLVSHGTYFEKINFQGKKILVASFIIFNKDSSQISSTIIDGSNRDPIAVFNSGEDSTSILRGFTIMHGLENRINDSGNGGGIYCEGSGPTLQDLVITENKGYGAGLFAVNSKVIVKNCIVKNNEGIGICLENCWASLGDIQIINNSAGGIHCLYTSADLNDIGILENGAINSSVGGISCAHQCTLRLSHVTISKNRAAIGGGLHSYDSKIIFDPLQRSNIYLNYATINGHDIHSNRLIEVIVDTFTVMYPTSDYAMPLNNFTFDIRHAFFENVNADLYVSPSGDDTNSGLTQDLPLRTLSFAMRKVQPNPESPCTIYLENGRYGPDYNGELFPIRIKSYVSINGISKQSVILDGCGKSRILTCDEAKGIAAQNMSLVNGHDGTGGAILIAGSEVALNNLEVLNCEAHSQGGGGIYIYAHSKVSIRDVIIKNNICQAEDSFYGGGGICITEESSVTLDQTIIEGNKSQYGGGLACSRDSQSKLINVIIKENHADRFGGGGYIKNSRVDIINCIVSHNTGGGIGGGFYLFEANLTLQSCSIAQNQTSDGYFTQGGGLFCEKSFIAFDPVNRSSIHDNYSFYGQDIFTDTKISVVVDTFTVQNPTDFYLFPLSLFTHDVLHATNEQISGDIYVDANLGNDNYSGKTISEPLRTIYCACKKISADSLTPAKIHLADGIYSPSSNNEPFPIRGLGHVEIIGDNTANTIVDAEYSNGVVECIHLKGFSMSNLTLQHGKETRGSAINIENSTLQFNHLIVSANKADGIFCFKSSLKLLDVEVMNSSNHGLYLYQGEAEIIDSQFQKNGKDGINCYQSILVASNSNCIKNNYCGIRGESGSNIRTENGLFLENDVGLASFEGKLEVHHCTIADNRTTGYGAGIHVFKSKTYLYNNRVYENTALKGGGIYCSEESEVLFMDRLNSIYNNTALVASDIYAPTFSSLAVTLDSFSVDKPTNYYMIPADFGQFHANKYIRQLINGDLYVAADGNDSNSGLSFEKPLQSLHYALSIIWADSSHPCNIFIKCGKYSPSITNEKFPLPAVDYISIIGQERIGTTFNAEKSGGLFIIENCSQFTIKNLTLYNGYDRGDAGLVIIRSIPKIQSVSVQGSHGCGILCLNSSPELYRVLIIDNYISESYIGNFEAIGAFCCQYSNPVLMNVTIANNNYPSYPSKFTYGGALFSIKSNTIIVNSLLYSNSYFDILGRDESEIVIAHSLLEKGKEGIWNRDAIKLYWLEGNLSGVAGLNPDYSLFASSPCIDNGIAHFIWRDDTLLQISEEGYSGAAPDIGALEFDSANFINVNSNKNNKYALFNNYPNPFNPCTTIEFSLPKKEHVSVRVFSILGEQIAILIQGPMNSGTHKVVWNAGSLGNGIYFVLLEVGSYRQVRKAILIK